MSSGIVDGGSVISLEEFRSEVKSDIEMEIVRRKVNVVGGVGGFGVI